MRRRTSFQASPALVILPPFVPTRSIHFSPEMGEGAVFAGRFSPEKGAAEAIEIAQAAGVRIEVFGDSYEEQYTRMRIEPRRGEPGVVIHPGVPRTSLWEMMARAAVVLCPARWEEPFGMVAAEAQACGTPVVAFRPRRGVRPDRGKDRVPAGLSRLHCRRHAEAQLDLELTLDAHEQLYERLAGARAGIAIGG